MRVQTEYMSFNDRWMISQSYDIKAHQQRSKTTRCFSQTATKWFEVRPDLSLALQGMSSVHPDLLSAHTDLSSAHPDLSSVHPNLSLAHPDMSSAHCDLSTAHPDLSPAHPGAPKWTQCSPLHSEVFPDLSQSLPWYTCTSNQKSQLLRRPAGLLL